MACIPETNIKQVPGCDKVKEERYKSRRLLPARSQSCLSFLVLLMKKKKKEERKKKVGVAPSSRTHNHRPRPNG